MQFLAPSFLSAQGSQNWQQGGGWPLEAALAPRYHQPDRNGEQLVQILNRQLQLRVDLNALISGPRATVSSLLFCKGHWSFYSVFSKSQENWNLTCVHC